MLAPAPLKRRTLCQVTLYSQEKGPISSGVVIFDFDRPVLVDTSVLVQAPDLINRWSGHIRLLILPEVIDEVDRLQSRGRLSSAFLETLLAARNSQVVETPPDIPPGTAVHESEMEVPRGVYGRSRSLSQTDLALLRYAARSQASNTPVILATEDRALARSAATRGIRVVGAAELISAHSATASVELQDLRRGETVAQFKGRTLLQGVGLGVVGTLAIVLVGQNARLIAEVLSGWGLAITIPFAGAVLYAFGSRVPLGYGITEVGVGVIAAGRLLLPGNPLGTYGVTEMIQIAGGLYIIVRGLDNISKAVKGRRVEPLWKRIFGARSV